MTEPTPQSPVAATPDPEPGDDFDYGKGIFDQLKELNGRLQGWDGLLTRETNTETSSDPATPPADPEVLQTNASRNANSPTSETTSSGAPGDVSKSETPNPDPAPSVDPTPNPPKPDQQSRRSGLGFLKGGKTRKSAQTT